jgi:cytochrome c
MQSTIKTLSLGLFAAGSLFTGVALAEDLKAGDLASFEKYIADNKIMPPCTTCHAVDTKKIGPSYNAVALHYKGNADAAAALEKKILEGGKGVWGAVPMTANATAKDHAKKLVEWILALNPEGDAKAKADEEIAKMPKAEEKK